MKKILLLATATGLFIASYSQWNTDTLVRNPVCTLAGFRFDLQSCTDGHGGIIMTWTDEDRPGNGTASVIYAQRIDSSGKTKWATNGVLVSPPYINSAETPLIVQDDNGGAIIIYSRSRIGGAIDNFAQRIDGTGKLLWGANGVLVTDSSADSRLRNNNVNNQTAVSDGAGGVFVTWQQYFRGIAAQHIDANGTRLWGVDGILPVTNPDSTGRYESYIVNTGAGTAVMAFQSISINLRVQRIAANGALLWGNNGVLAVNGTFTESSNAYLIYDSLAVNKNVTVVWPDTRNENMNGFATMLYAQKFTMAGSALWPASGTLVASGGRAEYPTMLTDGQGGFFMSYAGDVATLQHVDKDGNLLWGSTGLSSQFIQSENNEPFMCRDGSGGLILIDRDRIQGDSLRIVAQRFDASGKALWRTGGVPVIIGEPEAQCTLVPVNDGTAIAAWLDDRVNPTGVYAGKFGGVSGILPVTLLSFTAAPLKNQVNLEWSTAQEINSNYFEVQRSADGYHYSSLQTVQAHVNSNTVENYAAVDASPLSGNNFYRLKLVDKNGSFSYSKTITISIGKTYNLIMSPVPAHDYVTITGADHFNNLQFVDVNGKVAMQIANTSQNKFNVSALLPGVYFVRVSANGNIQVLKFVKQ